MHSFRHQCCGSVLGIGRGWADGYTLHGWDLFCKEHLSLCDLTSLSSHFLMWKRGLKIVQLHTEGFPGSSDNKGSACNAGNLGLTPGSERSPGEGNGNLLQYSCLENPMDGGAWQATWSCRQSDTTEQLHFLSFSSVGNVP